MRIRKNSLILVMCILCLLSSCGTKDNTKSTTKETTTKAAKSTVMTEKEKMELRNYYNKYIAEDNDYIYYIDINGLYKISKSDNQKVKLKDVYRGYYLTLHGDYIYFKTSDGLNRIRKDGQDYYLFQNSNNPSDTIKCINDILYIFMYDVTLGHGDYYSYNIKDEPTELKTIRKEENTIPYPDGKKYYVDPINEGLTNILYSSDINGKNKKKILTLNQASDNHLYFFVDNNSFYYFDDNYRIMKSNLNGKNSEILYNPKDFTINFCAYDGDWIYYVQGGSINEYKFSRINIKTKEVQPLDALKGYRLSYFDVADDYIFIREKGIGDMKRIKSDGSGALEYIK